MSEPIRGETSYEGLQAQVLRAMRNPTIKGVVFEVDSFGGELAGAFETATFPMRNVCQHRARDVRARGC